jgi:lysyl-tRNA synthetase class 2
MSVFEAFKKYTGIDLIDQDPDLAQKCRRLNFISIRQDDDFETAFFKVMLDVVEPELKSLKYVLLYDYPASQAALSVRENGRAKRFEIYVDGIELCNAFQELVGYEANMARYAEIEQARTELSKQKTLKDEGFFESIRKGLPESCGNALGLDRLLALILGHKNIDSVIPFGGRIYSID